MKRKLLLSLTLAILFILPGCSAPAAGTTGGPAAAPDPPAAAESTELCGSVEVLQLMLSLSEGYAAQTGNTVNVTAGGREAALAALEDGSASLAMLEEASQSDGGEVAAYQAVVVVLNPSAGVAGLSSAQLTELFSGHVADWSQFGGSGAVTLVVPERSDQARQLFEELLSLRTAENGIRRSAVPDTAVTAEDVEALVAQTPGAVGILAAGTLKDTEQAAAIDAIPFGEDAVRDGSYPLSRPVTLMLGVGAPQAAEEVYRYCLSQSADAAIRAAGFLPPTR